MAIPRTNVLGIFEQRAQADRALAELQRTGFGEDQIMITAAAGGQTEAAPAPGNEAVGRTLVTVQADHRHDEVLTLLQQHGAQSTQKVAR